MEMANRGNQNFRCTFLAHGAISPLDILPLNSIKDEIVDKE